MIAAIGAAGGSTRAASTPTGGPVRDGDRASLRGYLLVSIKPLGLTRKP